jgi:hypothetical protein
MGTASERRVRTWTVLVVFLATAGLALTATLLTGCQGGSSPTTSTSGTTTTTEAPAPEAMAPVAPAFQKCSDCHPSFDAFLATSKVLNDRFNHLGHLQIGYTCESCHPPTAHEGALVHKPTMLACFACHGQAGTPKASGACLSCHPLGFSLVPASHTSPDWMKPVAATGVSGHATASKDQPAGYCSMCHPQQFCTDCHTKAQAGTTTSTATSAP